MTRPTTLESASSVVCLYCQKGWHCTGSQSFCRCSCTGRKFTPSTTDLEGEKTP